MGIIGVVEALTLPNLNSSTGNKEKVAKVKKIYQNLSDAFGRTEAVYGLACDWVFLDGVGANSNKKIAQRMSDFLKVQKDCGFEETGCSSGMEIFNTPSVTPDFYKMLLSDGSSILFSVSRPIGCSDDIDASNNGYAGFGKIYVDINSPNKGANNPGVDIFAFMLTVDGVFPLGGQNDRYNLFDSFCLKKPSAACTGWVVQNGNMDYLKNDSAGKCPDGKTVLDWTTNITCK